MRKNSYRKCSRTGGGGVTRFAKDGPSYSFAKRERRARRTSFPILFFFISWHEDVSTHVLTISTTCTRPSVSSLLIHYMYTEYLPTHFFWCSPSIISSRVSSFNKWTDRKFFGSRDRVILFVFFFIFLFFFEIIYGWRCCRSKNGHHRAQLTGQKRSWWSKTWVVRESSPWFAISQGKEEEEDGGWPQCV